MKLLKSGVLAMALALGATHPAVAGNDSVIVGPTALHGADVEIPDLRGGFSHLIAALTADGQSTVTNIGIISRGYEHFIEPALGDQPMQRAWPF